MLWLKTFHLIFIVTWFSGLFYLPRLFVYHADAMDTISKERFKIMERKLLFWITTPSGLLATFFGATLLAKNWIGYLHQSWMLIKLILVALLWTYHLTCLKFYCDFKHNRNSHTRRFYLFFNELPALLLIGIIMLAVIKPF